MSDYEVTTIDLLRHGACEGGEIFRGSTDVALSEQGWQQMTAAVNELDGWGAIVSSPMQRCHRFAQQLAEQRQIPLSLDERFKEIHFGEWEGRTQQQIGVEFADLLATYWSDPVNVTPPGGEKVLAFQERVIAAWDQTLQAQQGQHWLLVAHGAVIRVIFCHLLDMPLSAMSKVDIPYAGVTRFRIHHQEGYKPWVRLSFHRGE